VHNNPNDWPAMRPAKPVFRVGDGRFLPTVLAVGALIVCHPALAQPEVPVSEKDFLSDMPVVLSVSRLSQRLDETPGAVTILDRDMIRRSGARDVADLMRLVPGFQVSNSFESVAPLVSYHGAFDPYSNRLELLIDGRSAYSPYFIGSIGPGLQTVALEDIERIEVLRGSNSATYGARAILGVINIVTRDTADTLGAQGAVTVGENGIRDSQARIGWGDWRGTFRLTADTRADDGLAGTNGQNRVSRINFRSDIRPNGVDEVQVRLGAFNIDSGRGRANDPGDAVRPFGFDSAYAQLDYKHTLNADEDVALKLSHTQESYTDSFPYDLQSLNRIRPLLDDAVYFAANPFTASDIYTVSSDGTAQSDVLTLQHTLRRSDTLRLVWGGEFRSERIRSAALYNTESIFVNDFSRLFGNVEWRVAKNWLLNASALAEHSSDTGDSVAPRLMLNWHVKPGHTLRAGFSKAYRPPSNLERFGDIRYFWKGHQIFQTGRGSPDLQAEELASTELGYLAEFPDWRMTLDARLFDEQVKNFIRLKDGRPKFYANDEDFAIRGFEFQLKWKPWQGADVILNQAFTNITTARLGDALAAPQSASTLSYFQSLPGQMNLTLTHSDSHFWASFGGSEIDAQATRRTDLRLAKALRLGKYRGELALAVQNMGSDYRDYRRSFLFEKQAFITLRLED